MDAENKLPTACETPFNIHDMGPIESITGLSHATIFSVRRLWDCE